MFLREHPWLGGLVVGCQIVVGFLEAGILTTVGRLALLLTQDERGVIYFPGLGFVKVTVGFLMLFVIIMARMGAHTLATIVAARLQVGVMSDLRLQGLNHFVRASPRARLSFDQGRMHQLVVEVPRSIGDQYAGMLGSVGQISMLASMLVYASLTAPMLTAALSGAVVLFTGLFRPLRTRIKRSSSDLIGVQRETMSAVSEVSDVCLEATAFGVERQMLSSLRMLVDAEARRSIRHASVKGLIIPAYMTFSYLSVAVGLIFAFGQDSLALERSGPVLLVVLRALSYAQGVQSFSANAAALEPSVSLLLRAWGDLEKFPVRWGESRLDEVNCLNAVGASFSYENSAAAAVEGASVSIERGCKFGLVGRSGSGKSTFNLLMLGLFPPDGGVVKVNGVPLSEVNPEDWRARVAFVPQVAHVLAGTVRDNVCFFRSDISEEQVWKALRLADLDVEVRTWPDGLETELGAGKRGLSGGQQQRLAIARALAGEPEVIFMDEPTSSVDVVSEARIADALERLPATVTLVIASHRKRILQGCDRVALMESGQVVAVGAPSELLGESEFMELLDLD